MFFVFIVYFILSLVIGSAAAQRGRSAVGWFLVSILTTPLLAGVFLLLFPSLHDPASVDDRALQESINKGQAVGLPKKQAVGGFFVLLAVTGFAIFVIVKNGERDASQVNETSSEQTLVPRGSEKPSFDCSKAKTAPARLICADGELARLDGDLSATFQDRKSRLSGPDQSNLNSEQLAWIKDRNTYCDLDGKSDAAIETLVRSKPCMASAIRKRIAVLAQIESATTVGCHGDGDVITVQGVATAQSLELANGLIKNVWLLVTDTPICVVDSIAVTKPPYEISVSRIQIIGQTPPADTVIELTGKLSTGNISQYYAASTAINVISGRRIGAPLPLTTADIPSNFDATKVLQQGAAELDKTLREKPWMEGYLRAAGINPRTGPMPPLSPAETRCRQIFERASAESLEMWKQDLAQCVADLRQEWMASH
jgi:uncharacterized protein YecT (DUF1311 family)